MYVEKMKKLKDEKEDYESKISQKQALGNNIRSQYFIELMGKEEYEKCKNYLKLFVDVAGSQQSYDKLDNELTDILFESMKNIRSSSTRVPNVSYRGKPLRLYPSGFGTFEWSRTYPISDYYYKDIIQKYGNEILNLVWKGNKAEMLKIFIEELDNWIEIKKQADELNVDVNIKVPNEKGIVYFTEKKARNVGISTRTYAGWGYSTNGIEAATSRYGSSDIFRVSCEADITPRNIYMFSYVYDEVYEFLPEDKLLKIRKMSIKNSETLNRIKEKMIPYVASEQI